MSANQDFTLEFVTGKEPVTPQHFLYPLEVKDGAIRLTLTEDDAVAIAGALDRALLAELHDVQSTSLWRAWLATFRLAALAAAQQLDSIPGVGK